MPEFTVEETGEVLSFEVPKYLSDQGFKFFRFSRVGETVFMHLDLRVKGSKPVSKTLQVFVVETKPSTNVDALRETLRKLTVRERQRLQAEYGQLLMDKDDDLVGDEDEDDEQIIAGMTDSELAFLSERIERKLRLEGILLTAEQKRQQDLQKKVNQSSQTPQPDPNKKVEAGPDTKSGEKPKA